MTIFSSSGMYNNHSGDAELGVLGSHRKTFPAKTMILFRKGGLPGAKGRGKKIDDSTKCW